MLLIENINIESNAMTKYLEYNYSIILLIKCLSFVSFLIDILLKGNLFGNLLSTIAQYPRPFQFTFDLGLTLYLMIKVPWSNLLIFGTLYLQFNGNNLYSLL